MSMPANYVRAFLKLQNETFIMGWEDARKQENWYLVELWTAWRYACKYRIERLVNKNVDMDLVLDEIEDQLKKTETFKEKIKTIQPRSGPNSDIQYLFLFD